jgi:hypothetical protein
MLMPHATVFRFAKQTRVSLVLCIATACYRYAPTTTGAPTPGAQVRFALTQAGSASLAPVLGRGTVAVEGRVALVSDTSYVLAVAATLKPVEDGTTSTSRTVWAGETVSIPRAAVAGVEGRTLDRGRTTTLLSAGAAAAAIAVKLIVHGLGSGGSSGDTGGTVVTP